MWILLLAVLPVLASSCTGGYNTVYDGQCFQQITYYQNYDDAKATCAKDGSHLPMLYTKEDQDHFDPSFRKYSVWIGLLCDGMKWIWEDGTIATYTNFESNEVCDSDHVNYRYLKNPNNGKWNSVTDGNKNTAYPVCVANVRSWICDTYWLLEEGKSDDMCYLGFTSLTSPSQAESTCQSQRAHIPAIHDQTFNDYVKRTAISYGFTNGIWIGLEYVNETYVWNDGSEVDYTNFAPGFPDTSFGKCVFMGINLFSGKWMNTDCSTQLPYICTKPALSYNESVVPQGCGDGDNEFYPGDEIFSPTWGSATGPAFCDYAIMDLDKTKKVTVEIIFFESNTCCDTLNIYDGLAGANVLKTISGYYGLTSIKVTASSNSIRMEWNAKSGAHVRGWHAIVGSV